jgi:NADPH-dependent 2,4-dienoyl-CoA reductase/sulfur reductase-like enzyme
VTRSHEALIVGAGPAGLATSRELTRAGAEHCVLERGDRLGHTWANLYDSLVLHTGRHLSALPGLAFPSGTPLFPTRRDFLDYLHRYASTFSVPIETSSDVQRIEREADRWIVRLRTGITLEARTLVVASGIVANPFVPEIPGRDRFAGRVIHSIDYRRPAGMKGRRVLVVGAGNSAGEISVELARAGAEVTLAVRTGATIVPREMLGIPIQYLSLALHPLPRALVQRLTTAVGRLRGPRVLPPAARTPCPKVPLIGLGLANALRSGTIRLRGGLTAFTEAGVRFSEGPEQAFEDVILATGFRAALGFLEGEIAHDRCGFGRRRDRVVSLDHRSLCFVGHNYDTRGGLYNISIDAPRAARQITRVLRDTGRMSTGTPPARSER